MLKHLISFLTIIILPFHLAYAAQFYRHIPFTLAMKMGDTVMVNYDFAEKKGIRCYADNNPLFSIDFSYKGRSKSARLPIILLSDHIPDEPGEELADVNGRFNITVLKKKSNENHYEVSCDYLSAEKSAS